MIAAVVLCYRSSADTISAVQRLVAEPQLSHVVVVDNGSGDGSLERVRSAVAGTDGRVSVHIIGMSENLGYSGGNNVGIRHAAQLGCEAVLVQNPDVSLLAGCLEGLLDELAAGVPVVSPILVREPDRAVIDTWGGEWRWRTGRGVQPAAGRPVAPLGEHPRLSPHAVSTFAGACFLARTDALIAVGGLPERLFLYGEEVDLTMRLASRQEFVSVAPLARAAHRRGASLGSAHRAQDRSTIAVRYAAESAVIVTRTWWRRWLPLVVLVRLGMSAWLLGHGRAASAWACLRGVLSGLGRLSSRRPSRLSACDRCASERT